MLGKRFTPRQAVMRLRDFERRRFNAAVSSGIRAAAREAMKGAEQERATTGALARGLWSGKAMTWRTYMKRSGQSLVTARGGKKKARRGKFFQSGAPPLILGVSSVRFRGGVWRGGVQALGIASNIERGAAIKPHDIPRRTAGGVTIIRHPGARVQRRPILKRRGHRAHQLLPAKVDVALERALQKAGL